MRINVSKSLPGPLNKLVAMVGEVERAGTAAGLDKSVLELVNLRASQINGCAFCLDMHAKAARERGERQQRLDLLPAWRETELFTETERAALELTEAITRLSETADVSDEVYERATKTLTEDQFAAVVWQVTVINAFNRLNVTSRTPPGAE